MFIGIYDKNRPYNPKDDIENGFVIFTSKKLYNSERLNDFLTQIQENNLSSVTVINLTKEGDPIYYKLSYDGNFVSCKIDNSKDKYGKENIVVYSVTKDNFYKRENKFFLNYYYKEILIFDLDSRI